MKCTPSPNRPPIKHVKCSISSMGLSMFLTCASDINVNPFFDDLRSKYTRLLTKYKGLERELANSVEAEIVLQEKVITMAKNMTNINTQHLQDMQHAADRVLKDTHTAHVSYLLLLFNRKLKLKQNCN